MNARRCDRCGIFYEIKPEWSGDDSDCKNKYSLEMKNQNDRPLWLNSMEVDLCKNCQRDFDEMVDKFLNNDYVKAEDKEEIRPHIPGPCDDPLAWSYRK